MDKPQNVISIITPDSVYLSQRNNVNALSEKREKEPSNQCMIAAYGEWAFQYFQMKLFLCTNALPFTVSRMKGQFFTTIKI